MKKTALICLLVISNSAFSELQLTYPTTIIPVNSPLLEGKDQESSDFGYALTSDKGVLVIGSPKQNTGGDSNAGTVFFIHSQDSISGTTQESGGRFGNALEAVFSKSHENYPEFIIGANNEAISNLTKAGMIHATTARYINSNFFQETKNFHQDIAGIFGTADFDDQIGWDMEVSDFDGHGLNDLAISEFNSSSRDLQTQVYVLYQKNYDIIIEDSYEE